MNYAEFSNLVKSTGSPVVLLEGTRELGSQQEPFLTSLATHLAREFPHALFRTGNAKGSDEAFAKGVAEVDASRLEFVLPYAGHRAGHRPSESPTAAIDDISSAKLQEVAQATQDASPQYDGMVLNYRDKNIHPRRRAAAQLILRDTLKVTGDGKMKPPVAGIFYVNADDPDRGGTGHTMRVCRTLGVPVINQFDWLGWPF